MYLPVQGREHRGRAGCVNGGAAVRGLETPRRATCG